MSPSNQYDFEQPLKSERNQRVVEGLQRYLLNRREFSHVTCHAVRKYLAIQFANKKKADKKSREDVDAVTRYQEGRDASKKTRIAKVNIIVIVLYFVSHMVCVCVCVCFFFLESQQTQGLL